MDLLRRAQLLWRLDHLGALLTLIDDFVALLHNQTIYFLVIVVLLGEVLALVESGAAGGPTNAPRSIDGYATDYPGLGEAVRLVLGDLVQVRGAVDARALVRGDVRG